MRRSRTSTANTAPELRDMSRRAEIRRAFADLARVQTTIHELEERSARQKAYFGDRHLTGVLNVAYARKTSLERQIQFLLKIHTSERES